MNNRQAAEWDHKRDLRKHWVDCSYAHWREELQALFPVPRELLVADPVYPFMDDFNNGLTPKQSYDKFDAFVNAEAM